MTRRIKRYIVQIDNVTPGFNPTIFYLSSFNKYKEVYKYIFNKFKDAGKYNVYSDTILYNNMYTKYLVEYNSLCMIKRSLRNLYIHLNQKYDEITTIHEMLNDMDSSYKLDERIYTAEYKLNNFKKCKELYFQAINGNDESLEKLLRIHSDLKFPGQVIKIIQIDETKV